MNRPKRLLTKVSSSKTAPTTQPPVAGRVTNDSVSKHREEMLSRARKFKYPFHRSKHKVAVISVSLVTLALILLSLFTGWRLYVSKSTSEFTYRITQILPFPVAKINGSFVTYENYLFQLRHNVYWLEQFGTTDLKSPDGERQIDYLKRLALNKALENTLAHKLAKKHDISVSDEEVDAVVRRISTSGGNLETILKEQYNLTESEYRRLSRDEILKAKVAQKLDTEAPQEAEQALAELKKGKSFTAIAKQYSDDEETKQLGGELGVVDRSRANLPPEVTEAIFKLKSNQTSGVISTPSGLFIVKVLDRVDENRAKVAVIHIKAKDMSALVNEYRQDKKLKEYISLDQDQ